MVNLVLAALIGCGNAVSSYGYGYGYAQSYYSPVTYVQQQKVYVPYVEKVKFVAVEQAPVAYYATLAAGPLRAEERYQEYRSQQNQQTYVYTQPAPQQQQTVYQEQAAPSKATPQQPYSAPEIPAKSTPQESYSTPQSTPQGLYSAPPVPEKSAPYGGASLGSNITGDTSAPLPPPISDHASIYGAMQYQETASPASFAPIISSPSSSSIGTLPRRQTFAFDQNVVRALNNNCSSCHTGPRSKGGFAIFDSPGQLARLDRDQLGSIYDQVLLGQQSPGEGMPQKRHMSGAQAAVILNGIRVIVNGSSVASR